MVIDSTNIKDVRELYSQTPPDYVEKNYYINTLQMKIDADWPYRPNRKWVEEETGAGDEVYVPLEVVIQTIKTDKGEAISDDWYRLVFRDCQKPVRLGRRYRFAYESNMFTPDEKKNIWLGVNQTQLSPTASQTVCRCNGTIGSIYVDENGKMQRHYEPIVQPDKLSGSGIRQSEVAVDIIGKKVILAQFNKYTQQYYVNQRFFIDTNAYDREHQPVYKITNIVRSNTLVTYDPTDVGLVRIYYDVDQIGDLDDVENRIAYNGIPDAQMSPQEDVVIDNPINPLKKDKYELRLKDNVNIPISLDEFTFTPELTKNGSVVSGFPTSVDYRLTGASYADRVPKNVFVTLQNNMDGSYTIKRLKKDITMSVDVTCAAYLGVDYDKIELSFSMKLADLA